MFYYTLYFSNHITNGIHVITTIFKSQSEKCLLKFSTTPKKMYLKKLPSEIVLAGRVINK